MLFFAPTFAPTTPRAPQFFPRPITDSHESQLDALERLESNRKARLAAVANVAARTPVGLEDAEEDGGGCRKNRSNNYGHYRYYPPSSSLFNDASVPTTAPSISVAEASNTNNTTATRRRRLRLQRTSQHARSSAASSSDIPRNRTLNLSHLSHSHISHDTITPSSIASIALSNNHELRFSYSPLLDPRARGGNSSSRNHGWYTHSFEQQREQQEEEQRHSHEMDLNTRSRLSLDQESQHHSSMMRMEDTTTFLRSMDGTTPIHTAAATDDWNTPEDARVTVTASGHGTSEDVYSQRRRRRRRDS